MLTSNRLHRHLFKTCARFVTSTGSPSENFRQRLLLAAAYRSLDAYGLNEGICNHLTALAPSRDNPKKSVILVLPYGLHWSEVCPNNLLGLDESNSVVEGEGQPETTAVCIHRGIYRTRPDVTSVMHTHMPYGTAIACLKEPKLLMLHQNSARFFGRVSLDSSYAGVADALEEGHRLGTALKDKDVLLMGHHGVLTVGRSIAVAFDHMYYFEKACTLQVLAQSTGKEVCEMPLEITKKTEENFWSTMDYYAEAHLQAQLRIISKNNHEFRA